MTLDEVFGYAYAVFHSPTYRSRYTEFLTVDFPRLPLTDNVELFRPLSRLGGELVALHLLESPKLDKFVTTYTGPKDPEIKRVDWSDDTVWLNAATTKKGGPAAPGSIGFRGVPEEVWNFHIGGYQVCEKWLKDRKDRTLSADDIAHYQRIVIALHETMRLAMKSTRSSKSTTGGRPPSLRLSDFHSSQSVGTGVAGTSPQSEGSRRRSSVHAIPDQMRRRGGRSLSGSSRFGRVREAVLRRPHGSRPVEPSWYI